jgi:hypothetical protein
MSHRTRLRSLLSGFALLMVVFGLLPPATALPRYDFVTPIFGLAAHGGVLFVADYGQGVVRMDQNTARLAVGLRTVTDVAPIRPGRMWALTSGRRGILYRVVHGQPRDVANVGAFEEAVNPDLGEVDSNPFDLARIGGGRVLIADAGGNDVLLLNRRGRLRWVATLPNQNVPTANIKDLVGCPNPDPEFGDICNLPQRIPAEAVATSVAVGPDGAYYVTELKGFPAPLGKSRIWRIRPGVRHVRCRVGARGSGCSLVADGFTSIVDLTFAPDGTAYVVEIDEASWAAVEIAPDKLAGGTVNQCDPTTWTCTELAPDLKVPAAAAVTGSGDVYAVVQSLDPRKAKVVQLA